MSGHSITLYGPNGDVLPLTGPQADEGYSIMRDGLVGYYDAVTTTEWARARRQRGGRYKGLEQAEREIEIPFRVTSERDWAALDSRLARAIPYQLDRWDENAKLARIGIEADDTERFLDVQRSREPQYHKDFDALKALDLGQGIVTYFLKAAQPMWSGRKRMLVWETSSTSGTGPVAPKLSNPGPIPIMGKWVLTPGIWTVPDYQWGGPEGKRVVRDPRTIPLQPVTEAMGGLTIDLSDMERTFRSTSGENVNGQVAGNYYFVNFEIPPYTPPTDLIVSVSGAPAGGARAEFHYTELWNRPWGEQ